MKRIEILLALEGLGWRCDKDEAGDYFYLTDIGEVQIQIIPTIGKHPDHFRVSLMSSVPMKNSTTVVAFVLGEVSNYVSIIVSSYVPEKIVDFSLNNAVRLFQSAISWASAQDIEKGPAAYRVLPTNSKGVIPLRYLAALAIAGDVSCLVNYQPGLEQGDRLGFAPYTIQNMTKRALLIARNVCRR